MQGTTTVILGGGVGGIVTANTLRNLLPAGHRIVVIEKNASFHLGAAKIWVMLGERTPKQVGRSLDALKKRNIEVMQAEILKVDPAKREVATRQGTIKAEYLVIALGADMNMNAVEGLDRAAHTFYTMEGATRLRDALKDFKSGEIVSLIPRIPIKCPPAPYEGAMRLHYALQTQGRLDQIRLSFYTVEPSPMPTAGPQMGQVMRDHLSQRNIALYTQKRAKSIDAERRLIVFEDGSEARYDLLMAVPPHEAPRVVRESGLTNQSGWIPVDPKTLTTPAENVYAIGDVTTIPLPGRYKPDVPLVLPKAAVFADSHARVVAAQIAAHVLGKEPQEAFDGKGVCYVEMGAHLAMGGEGWFFELPQPRVTPGTPDKAQYQEKQNWAEQWMQTNL